MYFKNEETKSDKEYMKTYNVMRLGDIAFEGNKSKNFAHGRMVENTIGDGIVSHVFDVFEPIRPYDLLFWKYLINNERIMGKIMMRCTKASTMMTNLVAKDFLAETVFVPSLEEQKEIGQIMASVDGLISLHQRKLEKLQEIKKSLLQNMFPAEGEDRPKIRFAGYTDAWGQERLGEMLVKNDERNKDVAFDNVESVSNKTGFTKQTEQFDDYSVASADLSNYYVIRERQFAYNPSRINVGSIAYKEKGAEIGVVSPLYISFSTKEMLDDRFLWYWFKTYSFDYQRHTLSEGGVRDTLSFDKIAQMEIKLPGLKEQQEIGRVLHSVDSLLSLHQRSPFWAQTSPANALMTRSMSLFSSSWMMWR